MNEGLTGEVINDRIFIYWVNYPFNMHFMLQFKLQDIIISSYFLAI